MNTTRYTLNEKQLRLLGLLYKFRFITAPLFTEYLGLKSNSVTRNLKILLKQEYIGWKYDKSYKLDRKPALYFLDKNGIALLKTMPDYDHSVLHSYYKNRALSEETQQHYLDTFTAYNSLHAIYSDSYYMFTKSELASFDDLPEHKPDLYLRKADSSQEYFITLAHDVQPFIIRKRLAEYIEHSEDEGWPSGKYPALLYVFKSSSHESQFLDYATKVLDSAGIENDELPIAVTTIKALTRAPYTASIWTFLGSESPMSLA